MQKPASLLLLERLGKTFQVLWESPLPAGGMAFLIYSILAFPWTETSYNYYAYLADAFLHGQISLQTIPPVTHDLVFFQGQYYLYWPPMPSVLLLPLTTLFGVHVNDVVVVMFIAALDVALVAFLLRQVNRHEIAPLTPDRRALLVIFFAIGSVLFPLAPYGKVWAMGQVVAFLFIILAYLATISLKGRWAFFLTGLALGCAFLTRGHTILMGLWPAYYLIYAHRKAGWKKLIRNLFLAAFPIVVFAVTYLIYNYLRFGDPFQVGLDYHNMATIFQQDYKRYGAFNIHYICTNLYYQYIYYPFPWREESWLGGSLFLLSPILFSVFFGAIRGRPRLSAIFLCLTALATSVPILLLMGTGWMQVGPRYTLDFTVCLLLLAALGIQNWPRWLLAILVAISCAHYWVGTLLLFR